MNKKWVDHRTKYAEKTLELVKKTGNSFEKIKLKTRAELKTKS